jgi:putative oxidoreductase
MLESSIQKEPAITSLFALVGRVLLAAIFVLGGWSKLMDPAMTAGWMASAGIPYADMLIWAVIAVELLGGLMLVIGLKARWAALAIAGFLVPVTIIFHSDFNDAMQMGMFTKNVAIMGGLLMVVAHGAGSFSLDRWMKR